MCDDKKIERAYCQECSKWMNDYRIERKILTHFRGIEVNVEQIATYCLECGSDLYVISIEEKNFHNLYTKYKELVGYVLPSVITAFRRKYDISKIELNSILGWNATRAEDGALQNQRQDEILRSIITDSTFFMQRIKDAYDERRIPKKLYKRITRKIESHIQMLQHKIP